mmetsp:Transcript_24205/g.52202  ORF Transcript_24205/g.52202 Transcript_24205/m.52202 type:complete len:333 (-) Transcript_24205:284-1282(-)
MMDLPPSAFKPDRLLRQNWRGSIGGVAIGVAIGVAMVVAGYNFGIMTISACNNSVTAKANDNKTHQSCQQLLNALDDTSDRRRKSRHDAIDESRPSTNKRTRYDMFEPEAVCFTEERFGSGERYKAYGDGPKFVCGVDVLAAKSNSSTGCLVYSIGSNNQIDFEIAVNRFLGCEIHTFDPTLSKPFIGGRYATFHPWGLGKDGDEMSIKGKTKFTAKSLEHIMKELGHEKRTIDILKIDCEGCEWSALPPFFELMASEKVRVDQVQIEMHSPKPVSEIADFFLAADKAKLRIFHKERNHWGCRGYKCLEYAFISESFLREANRATICPDEEG